MSFRRFLSESYEQRVKSVADSVVNGWDGRGDVDKDIERLASSQRVPEVRLKGKAWKDFVRDVKQQLKGRIRKSGGPRGPSQRKQNEDKFLQELARIIETEWGNNFPDGDPFDTIGPQAVRLAARHDIRNRAGNRLTMYDVKDWMDKAVKKHMRGYRNYDDFMAKNWDSTVKDTDDQTLRGWGLTRNSRNPWK